MVALTINWSRVAVYVAVALAFLTCGAASVALAMLGAVAAYAALCLGLRVAAAVLLGIGCMPLVALCVLATAFWQDHRKNRLRQAFGGPIL